jgi:putative serine protease PepD
LRGPQPAATSWWSDALSDPWRDPEAPVVVVRTPPSDGPPPLEDLSAGKPAGRAGLGLVLIVSIVSALLAGGLGGTLGYVFAAKGGALKSSGSLGSSGTAPLTQRAPTSVAALVKKVLPSVVTVSIRSGAGTSIGSGFVVSDEGYVITNNHVVFGGTGNPVIRFADSNVAQATIVGSDQESDISVLKIDKTGLSPTEVVPVELGDSDQVQVGDPVVAIGAPLALTSTVTEGIVSYLDRPIRSDEGGTARYYAAIQSDTAVNQGNSGGPLFDGSGKVVGINAVIGSLATTSEGAGNIGISFSIPIDQAKRVAQDIIESGKARRTVIGAAIDTTYEGAAGGSKLTSITTGGPAANAGLKEGDVILAINGSPIDESWQTIALVRKYAPGTVVQIDYMRGTTRAKASVTLVADSN